MSKQKRLPVGFVCTCGGQHLFSSYVFAHWGDPLLFRKTVKNPLDISPPKESNLSAAG